MKNIAIIGTGYVGLVTGTGLSELGHNVICIDKDNNKIEKLNHGEIPIYEPGLKELFKKNCAEEKLSFTTEIEDSIQKSDSPEFSIVMDNFQRVFHEPYYRDYINDDITARLTSIGFEDVSAESHFMTRVWSAHKPLE